MRRRHSWSATALACLAVSAVLIAGTGAMTARPDVQPGLATGPGWRVTQDTERGFGGAAGVVPRGPTADAAWLAQGSVPARGTRWEEMVRLALLDLHQLSQQNGAVSAGAAPNWNYAWPRDTAFVAVALARTGHHAEALQALAFLQRVQLDDGGFEARYLLDGSGPPDGRARQSDGAGWALWAAWEVSRSSGQAGPPARLRPLLDNATTFALVATDEGRQLPAASPDYWEVGVRRTSLGTAAPLLAGLRASQKMYTALGQLALAARSGAAVSRLDSLVKGRFGTDYERFGTWGLGNLGFGNGGFDGGGLGGGGLDAAVTFLMPPFAESASAQVVDAWLRYQSEALRPAGGLAPGSRWKQDGISWTPETALVAYTAAMSGRPLVAEHWMDWLNAHRTSWGSVPEKVLATGAPAGPAPLAWTASLVVLTAAEVQSPTPRSPRHPVAPDTR